MSVINDFEKKFNEEYKNGIIHSSKTSATISFMIFEGKREYIHIMFHTGGDFGHAFLEDFGDVVLLNMSLIPLGYKFQSNEDDVLHMCNGLNRELRFVKLTLDDHYGLSVNNLYFVQKSSLFDSAINCIKDFMDFSNDIIIFCKQYGEPTLAF